MTNFLYPALFCAAIIAGMWITEKGSRDPETARRTYLFGIIGGVFGGRIWFGLQYGWFLHDGGFSLFGFFMGAALATLAFHWWRFRSWKASDFLDSVAPAMALGASIHRLGCYFSGCCFGKVCSLPWAVQYGPGTKAYLQHAREGLIAMNAGLSLPVHPTQLYGVAFGLFCFFALIWLSRCHRSSLLRYEMFLGLTAVYCVYRFLMEFVRDDAGGLHFGPLTFSQASSLAIFALVSYFLVVRRIRHRQSGGILYRMDPS